MTVELNTKYPATTPRPAASPGMVVHSYFDISAYSGTDAQARFVSAETDEEQLEALKEMPDATVTFHELREGEPFFAL